ncbi:MAG: hypothetical protein ACQEXJ_20660 [Myxococcota bacterium]
MADATQPTEAPEQQSTTGDLQEEAYQVGWAVLGSSRTFMVLAGLLAAVVLGGGAVDQGLGRAELLERYDWAVARAILLLGLDTALTSWPFVLLVLLLALNGIGLYLRHRALTPVEERARRTWVGPAVARARGQVHGRDEAVASAVARSAGVRKPAPTERGVLAMRRGLWNEGLGLVVLGLVVLGAAVLVGEKAALEARVELIPGVDDASTGRATVRAEDTWIERQLTFDVHCRRADPADPLRRRTCRIRGFMADEPLQVGAGQSDSAAGVTLRPLSETPRPQLGQPTLLLRRGQGPPEVLQGEDGRTYELDDGTRLTPFAGPDGPLVVARPPDGPAALLSPALEREPAALPGALRVDGVPAWEVQLMAEAHPERFLRWAGLAFLVLGLVIMGALPHLGVVVVPHEETTEVRAWSFNRPGLPGRVMLELHALDVHGEGEEVA